MFSQNRVKPHSGTMVKVVVRYAGFGKKNPREKEEVEHTMQGQGCTRCAW